MRFTVVVAVKRAGVAVCWFAFSCNITTMSLLQFLLVMMKCKQQWAAVGRAQNNISRLESTCSCSISNCRSKRNRYEMTEMFLFNNRCCATLTASPAFLCVCPQANCLCSGECSVYSAVWQIQCRLHTAVWRHARESIWADDSHSSSAKLQPHSWHQPYSARFSPRNTLYCGDTAKVTCQLRGFGHPADSHYAVFTSRLTYKLM